MTNKPNPQPPQPPRVLVAAQALFLSVLTIGILYFIQLIGNVVVAPALPTPAPFWLEYAAQFLGLVLGLNVIGVVLWSSWVFVIAVLEEWII